MENNLKDNGVFCIMPWTHLALTPSGHVRPCSWGVSKNFDPSNNLDTVYDYKNLESIKSIKENMLSGRQSDYCKRCYEQEKLCGVSKRTTETFSIQKENTLKVLNGEDCHIHEIELRLGNMCNIGCVSCSPSSSNYFVKELSRHNADIKKFDRRFQKQYSNLKDVNLDWFKNPKFWEAIFLYIPEVKYIYIAGGEPTIIKENWGFLSKVKDLGYSKNIKLGISTNLTNLHSSHVDIYNSFKNTVVYASIDGFNDINNYIRYPSKWSQISKNLETLAKGLNPDSASIRVNAVLSIFTIWKFPDLWRYIDKIKKETNADIKLTTHTILRDPSWMAIYNMPDPAKEKILKILESLWKEWQDDFQMARIFDYVKNSIGKGDVNQFYKGKDFIEQFDQMRNNSWKTVVPELIEYWGE